MQKVSIHYINDIKIKKLNEKIIDIMNTKLLHNQAENIIFYEGDSDIHSDGVVQCSSVQIKILL